MKKYLTVPKKYRNIHQNELKNTPISPSSEVNDGNKKFQCNDRQSGVTNICKKFREKILNDSQEIEEHTPEWAPTEGDTT